MKSFKECITEGIIPFTPLGEILSKINLESLSSKTMSPKEWTSAIARRVKIPEVKIDHIISSQLDSSDMTIHGEYDDELHQDDRKKFMFVTLVFSDKDKELSISNIGLDRLKRGIAATIQHEMIHAKQYSSRDFIPQRKFTKFTTDIENVQASQKYLGSTDEVHAFATNIAHELVDTFGSKEAALIALRSPSKITMSQSINLFVYGKAFLDDWSNAVLKKLLKSIAAYIERI